MDPKVWGPHGWFFLHAVTLVYPNKPNEEDKTNMKNFISSAGKVLPCFKCRNNFKKHLIKLPLTDEVLLNRENLVKWLIDVHNEVNEMIHKPKMSYEDAINIFIEANDKSSSTVTNYNFAIILLLIVLLIALIILFIRLLK